MAYATDKKPVLYQIFISYNNRLKHRRYSIVKVLLFYGYSSQVFPIVGMQELYVSFACKRKIRLIQV